MMQASNMLIFIFMIVCKLVFLAYCNAFSTFTRFRIRLFES